MCYPVCGMVHIKEPLLLIGKSSPCGGSGFPISLYMWYFIIGLTPYNRKLNVLSASLNKTFPSFHACMYVCVCVCVYIYIYIYMTAVACPEKRGGGGGCTK